MLNDDRVLLDTTEGMKHVKWQRSWVLDMPTFTPLEAKGRASLNADLVDAKRVIEVLQGEVKVAQDALQQERTARENAERENDELQSKMLCPGGSHQEHRRDLNDTPATLQVGREAPDIVKQRCSISCQTRPLCALSKVTKRKNVATKTRDLM